MEDREVYIYSFEILLATLTNLLSLVFLAIVTRTVPETAVYLLGFLPLRQITGGYHVKNFRCFLILMFSYAMFLLVLFFLPGGFLLPIIAPSILLSLIFVLLFAPSADKNKPLSNEEIIEKCWLLHQLTGGDYMYPSL